MRDTKLENGKPTDIEGLERQMMIDCLNDLIKITESDEIFTGENIDIMTERNKKRIEYLRSVK